MSKCSLIPLFLIILFACRSPETKKVNEEILASMGSKFKTEYIQMADAFSSQITNDSTNVEALLGLAETNIILYIFGFSSRESTLPKARNAFVKARNLDSLSTKVQTLSGKLNFLDWNWIDTETDFSNAITMDPHNLDARHWYSLYLSAMERFDEAMLQSDTIMTMNPAGDYLIGRGSLLYFARRNEEMRDLMLQTIARDTTVPWGYDWLGMAYIELEDFERSISTYQKAFERADGTVEVGAGLGHALGLAGEYDLAKQMADYYFQAAADHYLPPVQRSFIHIGIAEYDIALRLLEQAYEEQSWFLIFIQIEPWYDPISDHPRFKDIIRRMKFPSK